MYEEATAVLVPDTAQYQLQQEPQQGAEANGGEAEAAGDDVAKNQDADGV
jgi:hypothetical protein